MLISSTVNLFIALIKYRLKYGFVEKCPSRRREHFSTKPYFNILIEHNTAKRTSGINLVILPAFTWNFRIILLVYTQINYSWFILGSSLMVIPMKHFKYDARGRLEGGAGDGMKRSRAPNVKKHLLDILWRNKYEHSFTVRHNKQNNCFLTVLFLRFNIHKINFKLKNIRYNIHLLNQNVRFSCIYNALHINISFIPSI